MVIPLFWISIFCFNCSAASKARASIRIDFRINRFSENPTFPKSSSRLASFANCSLHLSLNNSRWRNDHIVLVQEIAVIVWNVLCYNKIVQWFQHEKITKLFSNTLCTIWITLWRAISKQGHRQPPLHSITSPLIRTFLT